jgi:hypothetical protein
MVNIERTPVPAARKEEDEGNPLVGQENPQDNPPNAPRPGTRQTVRNEGRDLQGPDELERVERENRRRHREAANTPLPDDESEVADDDTRVNQGTSPLRPENRDQHRTLPIPNPRATRAVQSPFNTDRWEQLGAAGGGNPPNPQSTENPPPRGLHFGDTPGRNAALNVSQDRFEEEERLREARLREQRERRREAEQRFLEEENARLGGGGARPRSRTPFQPPPPVRPEPEMPLPPFTQNRLNQQQQQQAPPENPPPLGNPWRRPVPFRDGNVLPPNTRRNLDDDFMVPPYDPSVLYNSTLNMDMDSAPGLHQVFKRLVKPIAALNDPQRRDSPTTRDRIERHLSQVTPRNIRAAFQDQIEPAELRLKEYTDSIVKKVQDEMHLVYITHVEALKEELDDEKKLLVERLQRLEENERLSTRITTEKKDTIAPNSVYPSVPADEDLVRKAGLVLAARVKIVERKITFDKEPYNFLFHLCLESNKVAFTHSLTQDQQRDLVLSHIPSSEPEYTYMSMEPTLGGMFNMVSTMASRVMTITMIEKSINAWQLDNSTDVSMYRCVTALIDLLKRSMEHRNRDESVKYPELFRMAITRIQRENIPKMVYDSLNEARLRIRDTDPVPELNRILLGSLNRYIGMKKPQGNKAQNTVPQFGSGFRPVVNQLACSGSCASGSFPMVYTMGQSQPIAQTPLAQPAVAASTAPKSQPANKTNSKKGTSKQTDKNNSKGSPSKTNSQVVNTGSVDSKNGKFKKFRFVKPWPSDKKYMSKSGNQLSKECEEWFTGYCFKCGHNSHTYDKCRIYPETTTFLSLCSRCFQGFHETCRRRWVREAEVADQLKQMQIMYDHLAVNSPQAPFMITNANQGKVDEPDDD